MRFLVVEEDPITRSVLYDFLCRGKGQEVVAASSVEEAYAIMKRSHFDWLIANIDLGSKNAGCMVAAVFSIKFRRMGRVLMMADLWRHCPWPLLQKPVNLAELQRRLGLV